MKKIILSISVILVTMISCTKDEATTTTTEATILPQKIVTIGEEGTSEITLLYTGSKIKEISSTRNNNLSKNLYTYNNDLIVKIEGFENALLVSLDEFQYDANNKLKTVVTTKYGSQAGKSKREYTHNQNGTILEVNYDFVNNVYVLENRTNLYTISNGNITKLLQTNTSNSPNPIGGAPSSLVTESTYNYEYDAKKGPTVNITGFNQISFNENLSANNVLKANSSIKEVRTQNGVLISETLRTNVKVFTLAYSVNGHLSETKYSYQTTVNNLPVTRNEISQYFY